MQSLESFLSQPFITALKAFFKELNIPIDYIADEPAKPKLILGDNLKDDNVIHQLINEVYAVGVVNDAIFEGTTTFESIDQVKDLKTDYDGLLIFGVTLHPRSEGLPITRSQLAEITRVFNRAFPYTPVTIVFKYDNLLSFANSERIPYKQSYREGEKVGKVSLLRDIDLQCTHRGHKDILNDLKIQTSGKNDVNSFASLYKYWQEVFSVSILNKKFYKELQTWYFWAIKEVAFPNSPNRFDYESDEKFDEAVKEHKGKNVIRLLTRILFIWFIKEKGLIPEQLFDEKAIAEKLIKDFTPQKPQGFFATGKNNSTYYRAILQNLFFATLNQEMGKRSFRSDGQHQNVTNLMRYKSYFKDPDYFVQLMEEVVPFMNGGLFECLDKPHPTLKGKQGGDVVIYNDGFSDRDDNLLVIPDYLFFDVDEEVDLSDDFGNNVFKNSKTRGLIEILESYKFTITENTPIEEDVALDPELLGKVFENLLASYNPETKTTARKQTGSFYTPREIVNYMVDESLIAYLKNKITDWNVPEEKLDEELHQLLSYDNSNPFSDNPILQSQIIKALDQCTILDPACGSGAFPMGILQKMVHVLHKIDPNNTEWKQRQIDRVNKAIESLEEIDDAQFREQSIKELKVQIKDIEDSFENNELDYGRKLYLIENCIYGVDIQSIATQISKLRFFISLIVDQKIDKTKDNFGIRPLPNLETKFVAANTLIGIEKPKAQLNLFENQEIKKLEAELKKVRHKLFSSKSPTNKRKLREEDKELRKRISDLLVNDGWNYNTALQLASWDPYDQNESSSFFDPEWMFDIADGFDVVIGNPPYLKERDNALFFEPVNKSEFGKKWHQGKMDFWFYFLHKAIDLAKSEICFITSRYWLNSQGASKLINRISQTLYFVNALDIGKLKVFDAVAGHHMVSHFSKIPKHKFRYLKINEDVRHIENWFSCNFIEKQVLNNADVFSANDEIILAKDEFNDLNGIMLLGDIFDISQGVVEASDKISSKALKSSQYSSSFQVGQGVFVLSQDEIDILNLNSEELRHLKKYIDPNDVGKYSINSNSGKYLIYSDGLLKLKIERDSNFKNLKAHLLHMCPFITSSNKPYGLHRPRKSKFFEKEKIVFKSMFSKPEFDIDESQLYFGMSFSSIIQKDIKYSLKYLLGILNSSFANKWFYTHGKQRGTGVDIGVEKLRLFPIKNANIRLQFMIESTVDFARFYKRINKKSSLLIENTIDALVFNLYFPDHLQERKIDVLQFVERDVEKVMQNRKFDLLSIEEKENVTEKLHKIWSNPDNEVIKRINLFKEKSPDILKPILES